MDNRSIISILVAAALLVVVLAQQISHYYTKRALAFNEKSKVYGINLEISNLIY